MQLWGLSPLPSTGQPVLSEHRAAAGASPSPSEEEEEAGEPRGVSGGAWGSLLPGSALCSPEEQLGALSCKGWKPLWCSALTMFVFCAVRSLGFAN